MDVRDRRGNLPYVLRHVPSTALSFAFKVRMAQLGNLMHRLSDLSGSRLTAQVSIREDWIILLYRAPAA
jgi:hypothetical protein